MFTIAMLNQKGGVGKTTTTLNLGGALADAGYRPLLIDLDPQGHLTEACGLPDRDSGADTLAATMIDAKLHTRDHVASLPQVWTDRIDVVPTSMRMFLAERELYRERGAEYRLARLIELWTEADRWDVCLIDCPPSLALLTDTALVAADQVIIPVQAEDSTMRALRLLMSQIESIQTELRTPVDITGMVVNAYDKRRGAAVVSVYEALGNMPYPILATVPDRAAIREAWRAGQHVGAYAPDSDAADVYTHLVKTLTEGADA